jgi:hypothetical protein
LTVEQIVVAVLARALELSNEVPTTRSVHYRRVTTRQQQLFVRAAEINPDYFGKSTSINLAGGTADLSTLNPKAERVNGVRINNKGTSPYTSGDHVHIVAIDDSTYAALAPRATLRDYTLTQVGTDLSLVTSVWVDYSKRATDLVLPTDTPQLPEQFHELLVIDDTKACVRRMFAVLKATRDEMLSMLDAEEADLMADFERHVERFQLAEESRFGRTARAVVHPRSES